MVFSLTIQLHFNAGNPYRFIVPFLMAKVRKWLLYLA